MPRVLIVNMPFSNLRWPNIGPSLLKASLLRRGIECDLAYLNFDFAERLGIEHYHWIADSFAFVLGGERLFAKHFFGERIADDDRYWHEVLRATDPGLTDADRHDFESTERHVEPFLDDCIESIDWSRYAIVGFANSFQQTMPSIALAKRIKQLRPEMTIVFGGAACEGEMGIELLERFEEIDYVFLGEADLTFAPVVERILAGESLTPSSIDSQPVAMDDMDALPYPDFDDYFARLAVSSLKDEVDSLLFFETSRGCWWGQKHHCLFCGLNGSTLSYRSKSPRRAVDELEYLVRRHDTRRACSADNIFDHRYFDSFLPMLRDAALDLRFVYEMKTNLTRRQVDSLLEAGLGAAQLGIETFITPVLRQIGKGANALQNLQALKWFSEAAIEVKWNILYGFPGEDPTGYRDMAALIPALVHLAPPLAVGRVRLDRFSPYFQDPTAHGMIDPRPNRAFGYVYPFAEESLARMAYYYEYDHADGRNPLDYARPMLDAVEQWQQLAGTVTLRQFDREDGLLILTDTRPCADRLQHRLKGLERAIYLDCDTGRSLKTILRHMAERGDNPVADIPEIRKILDRWIAEQIMIQLDDRYLSLALTAR